MYVYIYICMYRGSQGGRLLIRHVSIATRMGRSEVSIHATVRLSFQCVCDYDFTTHLDNSETHIKVLTYQTLIQNRPCKWGPKGRLGDRMKDRPRCYLGFDWDGMSESGLRTVAKRVCVGMQAHVYTSRQ